MKKLTAYAASEAIQQKLEEKHNVGLEEIQEIFNASPVILKSLMDQYGERRYVALGVTDSGRPLLVVFMSPAPGKAKIITARDMTIRERKLYRSKRKK